MVPLALGALLLSSSAFAAKFANQFVQFELPPGWQCQLEGAEWVCQSTDDAKKRDAMIVLAAKLKGDQDSLDQYLAYLKMAKSFTSAQGKPVKSEPKSAQMVVINNQTWVDSLHLESEMPGFFTRYLATIKNDIGVLVTYSVNRNKYQQYLADFDALVKTLVVFRKPGVGLNAKPANADLFAGTSLPTSVEPGSVFQPVPGAGDAPAPKSRKKDDGTLLIIVAAAAVAGFLILRKKRRG
jgi:hypothetical protein